MWTRLRCRRCQANIPSVLQGDYKQAVSTQIGQSWSEPSSSDEGEDKVLAHKAHWAKETGWRELRDKGTWCESERRKQWAQGDSAGVEGRSEESEKMEVEEEVDSKTKLDQRKKEPVPLVRKINEFKDVPQEMQELLKEKWQQELQDIEQRRNDFMPQHQKTQKRSHKLQRVQDRKKQCQTNLGKWAEDRHAIEDSHAQVEDLGQKTQ